MFPNPSAELSLNTPVRTLTCLLGDRRHARFIAGSSLMNDNATATTNNQLYLLRFHEEMNEIGIDAQFPHATGEVWCQSTCPFDSRLLVTCGDSKTVLWRIPKAALRDDELDYTNETIGHGDNPEDLDSVLEQVTILDEEGMGRVSDMRWNPDCIPNDDDDNSNNNLSAESCGSFITIGTDHILRTWDIDSAAVPVRVLSIIDDTIPLRTKPTIQYPPKVAWDPHNTNLIAATTAASNNTITLFDLRTKEYTGVIPVSSSFRRNSGAVTDLDYNPNKPHVLATSSHDGLVKFWDLRFHKMIKVLRGGHTHAATVLKYNPFHDQLLLSGGSDGTVNLWRISSISSSPILELKEEDDIIGLSDHDTRGFLMDNDDYYKEEDDENMVYSEDDDERTMTTMTTKNMFLPRKQQQQKMKTVNKNENSFELENGGNAPDVRVATFDMGESVYDLTWSSADAWIFVSASYDGTIVLNHVPGKEKYKILL